MQVICLPWALAKLQIHTEITKPRHRFFDAHKSIDFVLRAQVLGFRLGWIMASRKV